MARTNPLIRTRTPDLAQPARRPRRPRFRPLVNGAALRRRIGRVHLTAPGALRARAMRP